MSTPTGQPSTLDEQIRIIDRVVKDCDQTRKLLDQLLRKVDDLYDEVKHFRDFLSYEKHRRDPTSSIRASSTVNVGADQISETLSALTTQLVKEWDEKLELIKTSQLHPSASNMPASTNT